MAITRIQGRMTLIFGAFFLLAAVSVGATFWGIEAQKNDALVINLAGRQRMLAQKMTTLSLEFEEGKNGDLYRELQETAQTFDQTLVALQNGGAAPYLPGQTVDVPPTQEVSILAQLDLVNQTWGFFRNSLDTILSANPSDPQFSSAIQVVEQISPHLIAQADTAVRLYEAASRKKLTRLRWVQIGFFASAIALLVTGSFITRKKVIEPLIELGRVAERIDHGDLSTPVQVAGPGEVDALADTLETIRSQLQASQEELLAWANTLEERVAQRTSELEALYQVSRDISSRLDIKHVLHSVTEKARELLNGEVAFLCLLDEEGNILNLQATSGPAEAVIRSSAGAHGSLATQVLSGERALPCGVEGCMGSCGIIAERYRASHLAAPLRMGERVIGALCVGSPQMRTFPNEAENLLTELANSATIALENARLYTQAERLATLEERQRIAAEMHDGLAQTLSYVKLSIDQAGELIAAGEGPQAVNTLQRMERVIEQAIQEVRNSISSLQEDFPLQYTLQEQLERLADEFAQGNEKVSWQSTVNLPLVLPAQETEQVLRVVREALLNAHRHSQAKQIRLHLEQSESEYRAIIEDDGVGFNPDALLEGDGRQHFGLNIMRARAARLSGRVELQSALGNGTRVILSWPIRVES